MMKIVPRHAMTVDQPCVFKRHACECFLLVYPFFQEIMYTGNLKVTAFFVSRCDWPELLVLMTLKQNALYLNKS